MFAWLKRLIFGETTTQRVLRYYRENRSEGLNRPDRKNELHGLLKSSTATPND